MIPKPEDHINTVLVACTVKVRIEGREPRTYDFKRVLKAKNGYYPRDSQGSLSYTTEDKGPNGEPIVRKIEWFLPYIGEFDNWAYVTEFLQMMRADDVEYLME